jgi:putative endonuclease
MKDDSKSFCVYAIQSKMSNRIYVGQTCDLSRRLNEHNDGRVKSTKNETPWRILAVEFFHERAEARWCESCLKRSRGKRFEWLKKNRL